jgi:O-succinylbenzoic acid--CoA ligase
MNELSLLAAAREAPDRDCLIGDDRAWSYADVAARVRSALGALRTRDIGPGDRVALTPTVDVDSIVWLYALFELGCPAVLLHPRLTERERSVLLAEAQPAHVITEPVGGGDAPNDAPRPSPTADQTVAIVYTSGSTGRPRGARLSRRAFIASEAAHAANLGWLPHDRWLLGMPPAHVGGLSILTRSLIARRCVVLSSGRFDPRQMAHTMAEHRVTLCSVVPTMLRALLTLDEPAWTPSRDLRAVLVGGASFPTALRELAVGRRIPALATYGCTEACSQIATQRIAQAGSPGCGTPLPGVELRLQDEEIQVRSDVLMDGYLERDRSGAPWTSDGWLRTGDIGSFSPDGQLRVHGRSDDLIVTGGENVSPQEVESWLETVPGIASACVFSVPNDAWGEEVVAALVIDSALYDQGTLRDRLADELAAHKRPKRFCVADALPLNRSGKLDRAAVADQCADALRAI